MNEFEKNLDDVEQKGNRDHPEQYPTDEKSLFDQWKSEQTVDAIPMEDVKLEHEEEKQKDQTKNNSSSEEQTKPTA
jgi:hypothetical protein